MDSGTVAFRDVPCDARVVEGQSIAIISTEATCAAHALEVGLTVLEFSVGGVKLRVERWVREPDAASAPSPRMTGSRVLHAGVTSVRP